MKRPRPDIGRELEVLSGGAGVLPMSDWEVEAALVDVQAERATVLRELRVLLATAGDHATVRRLAARDLFLAAREVQLARGSLRETAILGQVYAQVVDLAAPAEEGGDAAAQVAFLRAVRATEGPPS